MRYTIASSIASAVVVFGIVVVSAQSQPGTPPQPVNPPVAHLDAQFVKDAAMTRSQGVRATHGPRSRAHR